MLEITLEMMTSGNKGLLSKLRALPYHSTLYLNSCIMTFCTKRSFTQDFDLADCDCIILEIHSPFSTTSYRFRPIVVIILQNAILFFCWLWVAFCFLEVFFGHLSPDLL